MAKKSAGLKIVIWITVIAMMATVILPFLV